MQERLDLSDTKINHDLLAFPLRTPLWFWIAAGALALVVGIGLLAFGFMLFLGLGVTGLNLPVFWGFMITNFVFWVGISHAGVMISAILRLTQAEWRRPVTRAAEVLTLFSLATAALFPLIHTGRPWRTIYWAFPYDFARGIWPNVRSALIWDPSAILTYLSGSALFVYVALLPDLALARDHSTGWRRRFYGMLAMGFHGNARQWRLQTLAGILLSALILPVFVSVHSIVSWDFGMALVPAWHVTVFAPYFVIGAVHSGVSAVATLMAILRKIFHLQDYITPDHFDALGRLLIAVSTAWFYFFFLDFVFALYSREPQEVAVMEKRLYEWPYNLLFVMFLLTAYIIPVPLWLSRRVRRNITAMFFTSMLVNVGMWTERFLIIVPGLTNKQPLTFIWGSYTPQPVEIALVVGSFALVALGLLLFSKLFPIIPAFDIKEGQVYKAQIKIGRVLVPAVVKEGARGHLLVGGALGRDGAGHGNPHANRAHIGHLERGATDVVLTSRQEVLGVFPNADAAAVGVDELEKAGFAPAEMDVLTGSPYPEGAFGEEEGKHRLYVFPFIGAACGFTVALLLTIGTQISYPLVTGGKPILSIPPMLIVMYEGTMLGAILFTVLGILFESRLPRLGARVYERRIAEGYVGVLVAPSSEKIELAERALRGAGAKEVLRERARGAQPPRG